MDGWMDGWMDGRTDGRMDVHVYMHTYIHTYIQTYISNICIYTYAAYMHTYIHTHYVTLHYSTVHYNAYMHTCIYIHTYMHAYTHTHTYIYIGTCSTHKGRCIHFQSTSVLSMYAHVHICGAPEPEVSEQTKAIGSRRSLPRRQWRHGFAKKARATHKSRNQGPEPYGGPKLSDPHRSYSMLP